MWKVKSSRNVESALEVFGLAKLKDIQINANMTLCNFLHFTSNEFHTIKCIDDWSHFDPDSESFWINLHSVHGLASKNRFEFEIDKIKYLPILRFQQIENRALDPILYA